MKMEADVVIVGTGVGGLFSALSLPRDQKIIMITKSDLESSDSFLAQGGICMLHDKDDYDSYFEDTMKAGHYENRKESVDLMIRSSREIIHDLIGYGVDFQKQEADESGNEAADNGGEKAEIQDIYAFTREGAHSRPRILFHADITGKEITSKLLAQVKQLSNVTLIEYTTMIDIIVENDECKGIIAQDKDGNEFEIHTENTIWASGGIGGRYKHSTNFPHLTGDALTISEKHGIRLEHLDYVQIHPTTLYSKKPGRRFLISESVRGEGAVLLNSKKERFVNELLPRDVVTKAIREEMEKEGTDHVWLSMEKLGKETIMGHFPNIYQHHLVVVMTVFAVCVVSGNLFPVFVVQDGGNICFHILFAEVPAAAIFSDFVRVGENQVFVSSGFHHGFKLCASHRIISPGHAHYQIIILNQMPSAPEQIIVRVRHKHHLVVPVQIKGIQVGGCYMGQIQIRIKKIKFMSGKGNRSQYHNCSQQPFPVPRQPGKNSASVGTGGKMIVHVRYSISAFISMISV